MGRNDAGTKGLGYFQEKNAFSNLFIKSVTDYNCREEKSLLNFIVVKAFGAFKDFSMRSDGDIGENISSNTVALDYYNNKNDDNKKLFREYMSINELS